MRALPKFGLLPKVIAFLFGGQLLTLQAIIWVNHNREFSEYFWLGNDFFFLYNAAGLFLAGKSPYLDPNFVPLPPALYLPIVLHRLSDWAAFVAFRSISFLLVVVAILWLCRQLQLTPLNRSLMLLIAVTYGPFYTLLAGGNLDALMMAFLVFACARREWVRGTFLALSIGTKFYSLLLVPVLILRRRWKELLWAFGVLALLMLPFLRYVPDALYSVTHRTAVLRLGANESPAVLFILLFGATRVWAWRIGYLLLWAGTLAFRLAADLGVKPDPEQERFKALDYLPWMAAAPVLVFTYTGTILLPVIVCLVARNQVRRLHWAEWLSVAGFLMTGLYSAFYRHIFAVLSPVFRIPSSQFEHFSWVIAPLGLSAMLVGGTVAAWSSRGKLKSATPT